MLSEEQVEHFVDKGFLKLDRVIPEHICNDVVDILWRELGVDRYDKTTWLKPVIRLDGYGDEPFRKAANIPELHSAFDQLVGKGNWIPRSGLGSFPVRFPSVQDPGDTGWHVDSSFPGERANDFSTWKINIRSKGRALLMLFLFSDVTDVDAPTRILEGSHRHVAKILAPYGDEGLTFMELAGKLNELPKLPESLAIGGAGTVYLCHPFIVHAAQPHRGTYPRFLAQPPLTMKHPLTLTESPEHSYPVERAIIKSLID